MNLAAYSIHHDDAVKSFFIVSIKKIRNIRFHLKSDIIKSSISAKCVCAVCGVTHLLRVEIVF